MIDVSFAYVYALCMITKRLVALYFCTFALCIFLFLRWPSRLGRIVTYYLIHLMFLACYSIGHEQYSSRLEHNFSLLCTNRSL